MAIIDLKTFTAREWAHFTLDQWSTFVLDPVGDTFFVVSHDYYVAGERANDLFEAGDLKNALFHAGKRAEDYFDAGDVKSKFFTPGAKKVDFNSGDMQ